MLVTDRTYTEPEVRSIALEAAKAAIALRPVPSHVTVAQAAEMLGVSSRTVARMKLPRNSMGRIPYEEVIAARSAK